MARQTIHSSEQWHGLRASRIGASEVAALFDCGFQSRFQLWHEKKGDLAHTDYSDNERVVLGRNLEHGIASAAMELHGLELRKADAYFTDDECFGLGATPDYFLIREGGEYPAEVKNASWGQWRDNWITHEDGVVEPPLRYLLQVQAQLACTGAAAGLLIALISGDRLVKCEIPRHEEAIAEIRRRVDDFYASIAEDHEPSPQLPRDLEYMKVVWGAGEGSVDLTGDPDMEPWLEQVAGLRGHIKRFEEEKAVIEGRILDYCVKNGFATVKCSAGRVSVKKTPAKDARMVEYKAQPEKITMRITVAHE
jgi:predicted phage-related endonuclease